jgi:hypothetical protein
MDSRLLFHKGISPRRSATGDVEEISDLSITADSLFALAFDSHLAGCLQKMCCLMCWHAALLTQTMDGAGSMLVPGKTLLSPYLRLTDPCF